MSFLPQTGSRVRRVAGDSRPAGVVLGTVMTTRGRFLTVVELDYAGLVMVYPPEELAQADLPVLNMHVPTAADCLNCGAPGGHGGLPCPGLSIQVSP